MLVEEDDAWTIQVIYPEGSTGVPPLLCENDALISLERSELSTNETISDVRQENTKTYSEKPKDKPQRHVIISEDRYTCPTCEKAYNARRNLTRHINLECGKQPRFSCPYCDYKNYRRNEIKKHIQSKHNVSWDGTK